MKKSIHSSSKQGFTLIELITVLAIIGILLGLLIPAIQQVRETGRRLECANKIRQVAMSLHTFESTFESFPAAATSQSQSGLAYEIGWHVTALPFIDQGNLFDRFDRSTNYGGTPNIDLCLHRIDLFLCGSSLEEMTADLVNESVSGSPTFTTHFYGVMGPVGISRDSGNPFDVAWSSPTDGDVSAEGAFVFDPTQGQDGKRGRRLSEFRDGMSNTFLLGEISMKNNPAFRMWSRGARYGEWISSAKSISSRVKSNNTTLFNEISFGSNHPTGANFAMADGSTHHVNNFVDIELLQNLSTIKRGELDSDVTNQ